MQNGTEQDLGLRFMQGNGFIFQAEAINSTGYNFHTVDTIPIQ